MSQVSGWTHGLHIIFLFSIIPSIKNDDMEGSLEHNHLSDLLQPGHVFALVAPQGNDEKSNYWLARCVRGKQKHAQPITNDHGFTYPTGSVVVSGTWLWTYMLRRNEILAFEDYQKKKIIVIYLHLIIATNLKLLKHHERPKVKELFTISNTDHEGMLETLKQRERTLLEHSARYIYFLCYFLHNDLMN